MIAELLSLPAFIHIKKKVDDIHFDVKGTDHIEQDVKAETESILSPRTNNQVNFGMDDCFRFLNWTIRREILKLKHLTQKPFEHPY